MAARAASSSRGDVSLVRVLWLGDGGSHTGFSTVTHAIGERLVADYGHDIHVLAINHRGDYWPTNLKLYVPTLRNSNDIYGFGRVVEMLNDIQPDAVVILNDPAVVLKFLFDNSFDEEKILLQARPLMFYMPIDGINQPPAWRDLGKVGKTILMTKFAHLIFDPGAPVVPHGVDTEMYRPVEEKPIVLSDGKTVRTKRECKKAFGYDPDGFLVLRVDRNSHRKNFPDTVRALWPLMRKNKDIHAHFHCQPNDPAGYNLGSFLSREPALKERFVFPSSHSTFRGWPSSDLAALYNAADLFVSTAWGEGFGLTLAEAASCGTPIVAQNVTSIPEVVGPGAILVEPERLTAVPQGQDQFLPNVEAFTEAIDRIYMSRGLRRDLGIAGREHVKGSFSWDHAAARFHEFLGEVTAPTSEN
jgi:glycosyltransferase involved in cell wall biosynthesis